MKPIYLFIALILLSNLVNAQDYDSPYKYKKVVSIGISLESKVALHTKLITDIAHYYEEEKIMIDSSIARNLRDNNNAKVLRDTLYTVNNKLHTAYFKANHDTANAFNRLVNNVCIFLSLEFNRAGAANEINYDDTLFLFKIVNTSKLEQSVFKKDSLDYLISIKNVTSVQQSSYFNIHFDLFVQSKKGKIPQVIKMDIPFTDQQKEYNMFFSCEKPLECLIANITQQTAIAISERLHKDGFRK